MWFRYMADNFILYGSIRGQIQDLIKSEDKREVKIGEEIAGLLMNYMLGKEIFKIKPSLTAKQLFKSFLPVIQKAERKSAISAAKRAEHMIYAGQNDKKIRESVKNGVEEGKGDEEKILDNNNY